MNRCPNCAAQNREGAKFCTSCGFRLPTESTPPITSQRSPFATTSTMPPYGDTSSEPVPTTEQDTGFGTWNVPAETEPVPGRSWDAAPPPDTGVPVNDDMIASLVGEPQPVTEEQPAESTDWVAPAKDSGESSAVSAEHAVTGVSPTFDHVLKLVRDLEYELVELAEASPAPASGNSRLLSSALADLQDEDDLAPLRAAVETAQERPRDVDVMLDLVLRADAISALLVERDQLKSAILLFLAEASDHDTADESSDDVADDMSSSEDTVSENGDGEIVNDAESAGVPEDGEADSDDSQVI